MFCIQLGWTEGHGQADPRSLRCRFLKSSKRQCPADPVGGSEGAHRAVECVRGRGGTVRDQWCGVSLWCCRHRCLSGHIVGECFPRRRWQQHHCLSHNSNEALDLPLPIVEPFLCLLFARNEAVRYDIYSLNNLLPQLIRLFYIELRCLHQTSFSDVLYMTTGDCEGGLHRRECRVI